MDSVLKSAKAFATAGKKYESAKALFARGLSSLFPSKGKGKARMDRESAEALAEASSLTPSRVRGLFAFGDWLNEGNEGTERDYRDSVKAPAKSKGGRPSKSPAERIASILAGLDPAEVDAVMDEARDLLAALAVADDDSDDDGQ
jgi:hypothetical protein